MQIYIRATADSPRTLSLLEKPGFANTLLEWTATLAQRCLCPERPPVVLNGDGGRYGKLAGDIGAAFQGKAPWSVVSRQVNKKQENEPVLILSPFEGIISRFRLEMFAGRMALLEMPSVVRSSVQVNYNINPFWLKTLPGDKQCRNEAVIDRKDLRDLLQPEEREAKGAVNILGSQNLPCLYMEDEAMIGLQGPALRLHEAHVEHVRYTLENDPTVPLFYRFNPFNVHPDQRLHLERKFLRKMQWLLQEDMQGEADAWSAKQGVEVSASRNGPE